MKRKPETTKRIPLGKHGFVPEGVDPHEWVKYLRQRSENATNEKAKALYTIQADAIVAELNAGKDVPG